MKIKIHIKSIIFTVLKNVFFTQALMLILEVFNVFGLIEYYFSIKLRDIYFVTPPILFFLLLLFMLVYDKATIEKYSDVINASTLKGSAFSYLKNNLIDDLIASLVCALIFNILTLFGVITPVWFILYMTLDFFISLFLCTAFIEVLQVLILLIYYTINSVIKIKIKPVLSGIIKGIIVSFLAFPVGALLYLLAKTVLDCIGMLTYLPTETFNIVNGIFENIGYLLALPVAWRIAYTSDVSRRTDFIYETEGYIDEKDGILFHFRNYKRSEIAAVITIFAVLTSIALTLKMPSAFRVLFTLGGIPLTIIAGAGLVILSLFYAVYTSQRSWRIKYFLKIFGDDVRRME